MPTLVALLYTCAVFATGADEAGGVMPSKTIAVVDDNTTFLDLMQELLTEEGYRVTSHTVGGDAYPALKEQQPALIILDIRMEHPESGWQLLEALRLDPATAAIPAIVCSADARALREKAAHLRELRADVLEKPFNLDELVAKVRAGISDPDGNGSVPHSPAAREGDG